MGKRVFQIYDDGYLMLAYYIASHYNMPHINQALSGDDWLRARVRDDCVKLDLAGPFIDAIVQDFDADERAWLRGRLKELGDEIFSRMDKKRLRQNIREVIENLDETNYT